MTTLQKKIRNLKHDASPFSKSRIIKDAYEIKTLRKASSIIDGMFALCAKSIKTGQKESQLQSNIDDICDPRGKCLIQDTPPVMY